MRRARTSSSGAIAQNRPASVMSMAISTPASQRTSPCTRPKPESMYWVKTPRKLSMTPVPPMSPIDPQTCRRLRFARWRGRGELSRRRGEEAAAVLGPGGFAGGVVLSGHADRLAARQFAGERIARDGSGGQRRARRLLVVTAVNARPRRSPRRSGRTRWRGPWRRSWAVGRPSVEHLRGAGLVARRRS